MYTLDAKWQSWMCFLLNNVVWTVGVGWTQIPISTHKQPTNTNPISWMRNFWILIWMLYLNELHVHFWAKQNVSFNFFLHFTSGAEEYRSSTHPIQVIIMSLRKLYSEVLVNEEATEAYLKRLGLLPGSNKLVCDS